MDTKTLIVWGKELKDVNKVEEKIRKFVDVLSIK